MNSPSKDTLRKSAKQRRHALDDETRARLSRNIANQFLQSNYFLSSSTLGCYLSSNDEVDTNAIFERAWRAKKRIFAPVVDEGHKMRFVEIRRESRLTTNRFGIWEPISGDEISASELDVVVTPVVAFDENRNRIGMGGGYYDRYFSMQRENRDWMRPKLVGLAFNCQRVDKIAPNRWDIRLSRIFVETV